MREVAIVAGLTLSLSSACAEDRQPPADGDTTDATTSTGSDSTSTGSGPATDASTGPSWPLPTDDDLLTCVRTCELPSDCCPPGSQGECPSSSYPYDIMCIEGLCLAPLCLADTDCLGEGEVCREVGGLPSCVLTCDGDDAPCMAADPSLTCSGSTDAGEGYCFAHCAQRGSCGIQLTCDEASGVCVCAGAGQCQTDWSCV